MHSVRNPADTRLFSWPTVAALLLYGAVLGLTTLKVVRETGGHFAYALDDPYIHMAIAKNLALDGTWGVHAGQFSGASSSPLWTVVLGMLYALVGVREWLPLVLNLACAGAILVILGRRLALADLPGDMQFAVLAGTVLLTPLAVLTWIGMETSFAVLLTLVTVWTASDAATEGDGRRLLTLCLSSFLLVGTRYEGLFVVAGCAAVLALRGRVVPMAAMVLSALLPVVATGLWHVLHGWHFLPASIMMKQTVLSSDGAVPLLSRIGASLSEFPLPLACFGIAAAVMLGDDLRRGRRRTVAPLPLIFLIAVLLHATLAKFGFLYRYEAHLIALGVFVVGTESVARMPSAYRRRLDSVTVFVALFVVLMAFGERAVTSHGRVAVTAGHIYRQQHQVAAFLGRYYQTDTVALNDIGAVSFYTDVRIDDLMGLSSLEATNARSTGRFDAASINAWLARDHVRLAVIYDAWFTPPLDFQSRWVKVAEWRTDDVDVSESRVSFYAPDAATAMDARTRLGEFAGYLPKGTHQTLAFQ